MSSNEIPMLDLNAEINERWNEIRSRIDSVIKSTQFINGPEVAQFEENVCRYLGIEHSIGLNSGTDALVIGLRACDVGPGDEVITTPFTFFASAESISNVGAIPVLVDVEESTFNIDPAKIENAITNKTKAIIPVHLYGQACDMDPIMALAKRFNLAVIEDTAQGFGGSYKGKKLGTIGDIGTYSFFPSKNLGAFGDGGMIVCHNKEKYTLSKVLRNHGGLDKYNNQYIGYNSRLDSIQAAVLDVKLQYIDQMNKHRKAVAARYAELLSGISGISIPVVADYADHIFHQYTIRFEPGVRGRAQKALTDAGIGSAIYYPIPIHKLPVYSKSIKAVLPVTEKLAEEVLSLPMGPYLSLQDQQKIVDVLKRSI